MQTHTYLLLAVCANVVTAGLVRHGDYIRSRNYIRSFNQSISPAEDSHSHSSITSTPIIVSSKSPRISSSSSNDVVAASRDPVSKQTGKVPAVGDGPGAASILSSITTLTETLQSSNINAAKLLTTVLSSSPGQVVASLTFTTAPKQTGKVPAVGDGPGAASLTSGTPVPGSQSLTRSELSTSVAIERVASTTTAAKQVGRVPAVGNGPGAATNTETFSTVKTTPPLSRLFSLIAGVPSQVNTTPSENTSRFSTSAPLSSPTLNAFNSTTILTGSASKSPVDPTFTSLPSRPTSIPILQPSRTTATTKSTVLVQTLPGSLANSTVSTNAPVPSVSLQITISISGDAEPATFTSGVDASQGNVAMARQFNSFFSSMNLNSVCDPTVDSQAHVCIDGHPAQCRHDGAYVSSFCPQGEQCFALPVSGEETGIFVRCEVPSKAQALLDGTDSPASSPSNISTASNTLLTSPTPAAPETSRTSFQGSSAADGPTLVSETFSQSSSTATSPTLVSKPPSQSSSAANSQNPLSKPSSPSSSTAASPTLVSKPSSQRSSTATSQTPLSQTSPSSTSTTASLTSVPSQSTADPPPLVITPIPHISSGASPLTSSQIPPSSTSTTTSDEPAIVIVPVPRASATTDSPSADPNPARADIFQNPQTTTTPAPTPASGGSDGPRLTVTETTTITVTATIHDHA